MAEIWQYVKKAAPPVACTIPYHHHGGGQTGHGRGARGEMHGTVGSWVNLSILPSLGASSMSRAKTRWRDPAGDGGTDHLPLDHPAGETARLATFAGPRAIEDDAFPFELLSEIAEAESWRKEINRPTTHIHKWWAQRLGTVFRAMAIGAFAPSGADLYDLFYKPVRAPDAVVLDPFMGSGTTIAEAVKLGARAIGRDINPVAYFLVKCALTTHDRAAILDTYRAIERDVAERLRGYYRAALPDGSTADVLYYFWVKTVPCPSCQISVDLFSSAVFAGHADPKRHPTARALCPHCGGINDIHFRDREAECASCSKAFDPRHGPANGQNATCPGCSHSFAIAKTIRATGEPPSHRMYAKLALLPDGSKAYLPADDADRRLYAKARGALARRKAPHPVVAIEPGHNTNQALGYNYGHWHQMFNARQLLCLSILADRIRAIEEPPLRELFTCLFSGALEFNNMFASYKGEGTGAVRHMFAHHILKPERVPLEANLWGTPKSSGAFSTMFEGRIRRALDYAERPFELKVGGAGGRKGRQKVYGLSEPLGSAVSETYGAFADGGRLYLSCGDSSATDLPDKSVDAVLTDPPFFDNVHYSQLADFFHVWQRHILGEGGARREGTTRSGREVQHAQAEDFASRLGAVWGEMHRVLKDDGLLAFTYHHSRPEGWSCVLRALMEAGFAITATHPIKAEMSVAMPKRQAKEPIDLDIIVVCRKRPKLFAQPWDERIWEEVAPRATAQARRLLGLGRRLSRNDVRIIVMAQILRRLSGCPSLKQALYLLHGCEGETEALIGRIHALQAGRRGGEA